ncbi:pilus assembly protein TadG-related protein [Qipengyuania mesophila]|uniref:pilus assembly protein TadG-related protein n=1 Tax=Qipengyuania mesophila TaxID=2867246 RepID=UPI003516229F
MAFFRRLLASLSRDNRGNVLAIVGAALVPLTIMIGSGIDLSRAYMAKSKMQSACDSASLAARRVLLNDTLTTSVETTGKEFFGFNFPQGLYGTAAFTPTVTKPSAGVIRVAANTTIPTVVMKLFGFGSLPVAVTCDASLNFVNTDIVLVLDVTGSMANDLNGTPKIDALRDAVLALYDELAPVQTQLESQGLRLRYGIVPYSSTVNVGRLLYAKDPSYIRSSVTVPSRVANFNADVYTPQTPTSSGSWDYASGSYTSSACQSWVESSSTTGGGPAPTATTVTRYQGSSSSSSYVQSQDWGWSGASDTSGTYRSCRRWKVVETTTYATGSQKAFSSWTYQQTTYDLSNYITPTGSLTYATSGAGTVPAPGGTYNLRQLAASGTGTSTSTATWNGCIEERDTTTSIDGGTSLTIPSGAKDLDINLIPSSDATRWRPMVPDLIYTRSGGTTSQTSTNSTTTSGWILNYGYSQGYWACPTEARRLAVWDRTSLDTYLTGLQTVGGTYHDIGMIWGARMVSTGGAFGDACTYYNSMPCNRHVIFMTDGQQTAYCNVYTAYGVEQNDMRVTGSGSCTDQLIRHEQRFRMACNAAKNLGASVWVIGFDTALNSNLSGCASSSEQADTASNRTALIAKFQQIGNKIGALRLTQ